MQGVQTNVYYLLCAGGRFVSHSIGMQSIIPWTVLALVSGSAGTLLPSLMVNWPCANGGPSSSPFDAPFFAVGLIFAGNILALASEALCGRCWGRCSSCCSRRQALEKEESLLQAPPEEPLAEPPAQLPCCFVASRTTLILLPGALNFGSCFCQISSLFFISGYSLAGMRGVLILGVAVASWALSLKDSPAGRWKEWACIAACCLGAFAVGVAGILSSASGVGDGASGAAADLANASAGSVAFGLGLCALGYVLASLQYAIEQKMMEGAYAATLYSKWRLLGVEGVEGLLLSLLALFSSWIALREDGDSGGSATASSIATAAGGMDSLSSLGSSSGSGISIPIDDPAHVIECLARTPAIVAVACGYIVASFTFNISLMHLGGAYGGNFRAFVFTARGLLTWIIELLFYSSFGASTQSYGVPLTPYSALTAAGFALLIGGGLLRFKFTAPSDLANAAAPTDSSKLNSNDAQLAQEIRALEEVAQWNGGVLLPNGLGLPMQRTSSNRGTIQQG